MALLDEPALKRLQGLRWFAVGRVAEPVALGAGQGAFVDAYNLTCV